MVTPSKRSGPPTRVGARVRPDRLTPLHFFPGAPLTRAGLLVLGPPLRFPGRTVVTDPVALGVDFVGVPRRGVTGIAARVSTGVTARVATGIAAGVAPGVAARTAAGAGVLDGLPDVPVLLAWFLVLGVPLGFPDAAVVDDLVAVAVDLAGGPLGILAGATGVSTGIATRVST